MKRLALLLLVLVSFSASAQIVSDRGSAGVTVRDYRWMSGYNSFQPRFADTTAASAQKGIDSAGAIFYNYSTKSFWYRQHSPKKWVEMTSSISGNSYQVKITSSDNSGGYLDSKLLAGYGFTKTTAQDGDGNEWLSFFVDTSTISTRAWRQKGLDSLAGVISGSYLLRSDSSTSSLSNFSSIGRLYKAVDSIMKNAVTFSGVKTSYHAFALGGAFNLSNNRNNDYVSNGRKPYQLEVIHNDSLYSVDSTAYGQFAVTSYSNNTGGNSLHSRKARGTQLVPLPVQSGDRLLSLGAKGYTSAGDFGTSSIAILAEATESYTSTAQGALLKFEVTPTGTATRRTSLTLNNDGSATFAYGVKASGLLDIWSSNMYLGSDADLTSRSNNVTKLMRIGFSQYNNGMFTGFLGLSNATENYVYLGGGTSEFNAATGIRFYTAANNTTTSGTERGRLFNTGNWFFGGSPTDNGYTVDVNGTLRATSLTTSTPSSGTAAAWKLGSFVNSGTWTVSTTKYIQVEIGGVAYKLAIVE